jgi:hypothetical protein
MSLVSLDQRLLTANAPPTLSAAPTPETTREIDEEDASMKIVVIGGTGLIGSKLVAKLRDQGHDARPAAPNTGVNTLTGGGLADALSGASVVVDVSNSPSFEEPAVMNFFRTSTRQPAGCGGR